MKPQLWFHKVLKMNNLKDEFGEYKIVKPYDGESEIKDYGNGITLEIECGAGDIIEIWRKNGKYHRDDDLPAMTKRCYHTHVKLEESWFINGVLKRKNVDSPTNIYYYDFETKIERQEWHNIDNELHRDNGQAACIYYHKNGKESRKEWWINGNPERENNLPVIVDYDENGTVINEVSGEHQRQRLHEIKQYELAKQAARYK